MSVRFEIARQIGGGAAGLFKPPAPPAAVTAVGMGEAAAMAGPMASGMMTPGTPTDSAPSAPPSIPIPPLPKLQNAAYYSAIAPALAGQTKTALTQATSPQEWNALFLSSPEFMHR
jgi:hypothetical protein